MPLFNVILPPAPTLLEAVSSALSEPALIEPVAVIAMLPAEPDVDEDVVIPPVVILPTVDVSVTLPAPPVPALAVVILPIALVLPRMNERDGVAVELTPLKLKAELAAKVTVGVASTVPDCLTVSIPGAAVSL